MFTFVLYLTVQYRGACRFLALIFNVAIMPQLISLQKICLLIEVLNNPDDFSSAKNLFVL